MSMQLMVEAMTVKVGNSTRKLVLLKLADQASDKGECWPSYKTIAQAAECSRTTAISHIEWLENHGFLRVESRKIDGRTNMTFQLTAARRRLVWHPPNPKYRKGFNSQPPEGGWDFGL